MRILTLKSCCDNMLKAVDTYGVQVVEGLNKKQLVYVGDENVNFCPYCGARVTVEEDTDV